MNLRTYLMIKMAETYAEQYQAERDNQARMARASLGGLQVKKEQAIKKLSPEKREKYMRMRGNDPKTYGLTQSEIDRAARTPIEAPKKELARRLGVTDADLKPSRGLSSFTKARANAANFLNAERGRAYLAGSMLSGNHGLGSAIGAGAMIGGGGLAGAGLGAVGGLSAADALGLDADNDAYLARLGRYALMAGGAGLGGAGGAGLGAIGAGHLLGSRVSQQELARAMRRGKMDQLESTLQLRSGING